MITTYRKNNNFVVETMTGPLTLKFCCQSNTLPDVISMIHRVNSHTNPLSAMMMELWETLLDFDLEIED